MTITKNDDVRHKDTTKWELSSSLMISQETQPTVRCIFINLWWCRRPNVDKLQCCMTRSHSGIKSLFLTAQERLTTEDRLRPRPLLAVALSLLCFLRCLSLKDIYENFAIIMVKCTVLGAPLVKRSLVVFCFQHMSINFECKRRNYAIRIQSLLWTTFETFL